MSNPGTRQPRMSESKHLSQGTWSELRCSPLEVKKQGMEYLMGGEEWALGLLGEGLVRMEGDMREALEVAGWDRQVGRSVATPHSTAKSPWPIPYNVKSK